MGALAGICLLLKLHDTVILLLEVEKLNFSELKFVFQLSTSTSVNDQIVFQSPKIDFIILIAIVTKRNSYLKPK